MLAPPAVGSLNGLAEACVAEGAAAGAAAPNRAFGAASGAFESAAGVLAPNSDPPDPAPVVAGAAVLDCGVEPNRAFGVPELACPKRLLV